MIEVHADDRSGLVKPLHGVNLGPVERRWIKDYRDYFRRAGIPSVRVHDVPHFITDAVDLHCIFPNPAADPDDPASYRFRLTDHYLETIRDVGAEVYFRLGESIEHQPEKLYIRSELWTPEKMSRVCLNIVRHYNDGWADGHEWGIRHWEFWNEPENQWRLPPDERRCWTGTADEFYELYRATAVAIKEHDPTLKVGLAGFMNTFFALPNDHPKSIPEWRDVLPRCVAAGVPVDFVSWHSYATSWNELTDSATLARTYLDSHGLPHAESHLTEWNYLPLLQDADGTFGFTPRTSFGYERYEKALAAMIDVRAAAFIFGAFVRMQDCAVDIAHHYTGISEPWGLFAQSGRPNNKYEAFVAFNQFVDKDADRVRCEFADEAEREVLAIRSESNLVIGVARMDSDPTGTRVRITSKDSDSVRLLSCRSFAGNGWVELEPEIQNGNIATIPDSGPAITILSVQLS